MVSPSSSNRPSSWTARAAGASAKLKYCNSSDNTKSADHDRARPRRVRAPMKCHSPRVAIVLFLRVPEKTTIDKTSPNEWSPREVPEWDLEPVKAGLGPVLPVPLKNPPRREVTAT